MSQVGMITVHAPLLELAFDDNNIGQDVYYQNM